MWGFGVLPMGTFFELFIAVSFSALLKNEKKLLELVFCYKFYWDESYFLKS